MITADVSVRPALPDDLPAIAAIQLASWANLLGPAPIAGLSADAIAAQWAGAVADRDPRRRVLVALAGPAVVGFAAASPTANSAVAHEDRADAAPEGWVGELVALEVAPHAQRQGHGSRLLAAAADLSRDAGAHHLGVWIAGGDSARKAFLEAAGFAEAGLRRRLGLPDGSEAEEILLTTTL